jgi:GT2 family glycosyltransferase
MGLVRLADGVPGRPFDGYAGTWPGYFSNANCIRNCSAASRVCLMTRREAFDSAGGWDEQHSGDLLDIDFGLRLAALGLRIVCTPYARFVEHVPGAGTTPDPAGIARLRARWGGTIDRDPYYNQHFVSSNSEYLIRVD